MWNDIHRRAKNLDFWGSCLAIVGVGWLFASIVGALVVNDEARDIDDTASVAEHITLTALGIAPYAVLGAVLVGAGLIVKAVALVAEAHAEAAFAAADISGDVSGA